ncbi:hypothetical protein COV12_01500 [Candidatus Woesearchaeota archaeon CG10_big_fil_rev_8_21_14_0_10_32_24]|nr:MAG: hypothetical protein COV12_01500 [Candidatus Woesearchaeota archaeon CG10_big_fil_rev_8_21_14_0_10_32_24]
MKKTIESIILVAGLLYGSSVYGANKNEISPQKYEIILNQECRRVRFEGNAVICDDSYCKKTEQADCGRKYCLEEVYLERWRFSPQDLQKVQFINRKGESTFPYGLLYQSHDGKQNTLLFRTEKVAKELKNEVQK